jgi:hypothetical protein
MEKSMQRFLLAIGVMVAFFLIIKHIGNRKVCECSSSDFEHIAPVTLSQPEDDARIASYQQILAQMEQDSALNVPQLKMIDRQRQTDRCLTNIDECDSTNRADVHAVLGKYSNPAGEVLIDKLSSSIEDEDHVSEKKKAKAGAASSSRDTEGFHNIGHWHGPYHNSYRYPRRGLGWLSHYDDPYVIMRPTYRELYWSPFSNFDWTRHWLW